MIDYLNFNDLKSLIIGVVGGFLVLGFHRYYSNFTIKNVARRLKETEAQRAQLDNLAKSDRALLIKCFQGVFTIFGIICMTICMHILLSEPGLTLGMFVLVLLWFIPSVACIGIVYGLQQVADYPKSTKQFDARIAKLKEKLLGNHK